MKLDGYNDNEDDKNTEIERQRWESTPLTF